MIREAGTSFTVRVDLLEVPTTGTTTYTIRDHDGSPISGHIDQPLPDGQIVTVDFPSAITALTPGSDFGKRTLVVRFTDSDGSTKIVTKVVRLIPFINTYVTPEMVRDWIGLNETELPVDQVNIPSAYLAVKRELEDIDTLLAAGDATEVAANDAILARAVLDLIPSLQLTVARSQTDGPISFDRFSELDLERLAQQARDLYDAALDTVGRTAVEPDLFTVVQRADPFTGG